MKSKGLNKIMISTVDTDVVVLSVSIFKVLDINEQWVVFGKGTDCSYISAHIIAKKLGDSCSSALTIVHTITGCDTTSCCNGQRKNRKGYLECISRYNRGISATNHEPKP